MEYRIEHEGKVFIVSENEIYCPKNHFCAKIDRGQFEDILRDFERLGAIILAM